jgi:hypothetical protein
MAFPALTICRSELESTAELFGHFRLEGPAMHARSLLIAAAALTIASIAAAEPAKPPAREGNANATRPAAVMLASAEQIPTQVPTATQDANAAPAKPVRHGRVTTCRCGDQTVQH